MIWHIHHEVIITVSLVDIIFSYKYKVKEVEKNTFFFLVITQDLLS